MLLYLAMIQAPADKDKFEALYQKYRYLMLRVAKNILHNHHDAEDAVHEAFIAIIRNIDKISDAASPETKSLVVIIVERKAIDILRKKSRQPALELNQDVLGIEIPLPGDNGLADAIARLPGHYREAILMRYDNGLTTREIAKLLDISESGVRKLLTRAKRALQSELDKVE